MVSDNVFVKNTFESGSLKDATIFFETCVKNAFPTCEFRLPELTHLKNSELYAAGKSLNHCFEIFKSVCEGSEVWEVVCRRRNGTSEKHVYVDFDSLEFVAYKE